MGKDTDKDKAGLDYVWARKTNSHDLLLFILPLPYSSSTART